jgi:hypothetical protein
MQPLFVALVIVTGRTEALPIVPATQDPRDVVIGRCMHYINVKNPGAFNAM